MVFGRCFAAAALVATFAAGSTAAPLYAPVGPQQNVPFATVTGGGWTQCFAGPYGASTLIADALAGCGGDLLMMAAAGNGSNQVQLLAWATLEDVTTVTALNEVHNANGTDWYFNDASWGFAPQGFGIDQSSCDINSAPGFPSAGDSGDLRLCWHTDFGTGDGAPTFLNGGWRVGNATFLNDEPTTYTRYLFTANSLSVPEPATSALLLLGAVSMARRVVRRRLASK
jgi:hypothetical protein